MNLANLIRSKRITAKLSQAELARRIGTNQAYIYRLETARTPLYTRLVEAIAKELNISINEILEADAQPPSPAPRADPVRRPPIVDWDQQPLGKLKDARLASRLNCHPSLVAASRQQRGIPPAPHDPDVLWFSRHQRDILRMLAQGISKEDIAHTMRMRPISLSSSIKSIGVKIVDAVTLSGLDQTAQHTQVSPNAESEDAADRAT